MTPDILAWMSSIVRPQAPFGRVLETGAQNINGSPRPLIAPLATEYIGTDMQAGEDVNQVVNNRQLLHEFGAQAFDTILCCEVLEHDGQFWGTVQQMHDLLKPKGALVITTPTFGFPLHRYPCDYWRFGEDAYREIFFPPDRFTLIDLRHLDSPCGPKTTLVGIGRKF